MHNLRFLTDPNLLVLHSAQINRVLIGQIIKQIQVLLGDLPLLLKPKYQINPLLQMHAHRRRLQFLAMDGNEMIGILTPRGKDYIMDSLFHLGKAEVVVLDVEKELGEVEELWDELPHVGDL
jgi:hypothetical protein